MVDLEDPDAIHEIAAPVGEGVQAGAEDHVLPDAPADRLLDQVLGEPGPDAHPPAERQHMRPGQLGPNPPGERQPFLTRQP
jgi:hypothetical protein